MTINKKTLSLKRLEAILNAYGSRPSGWPVAERQAACALLESSPEARAIQKRVAVLDDWLAEGRLPAFEGLQARLLNQPLPAQAPARPESWSQPDRLQRLLDWLLPAQGFKGRLLWRPMVLACVPLVLGIYVGSQFSGDASQPSSPEEELYFISLGDYAEML